MGKLSFWESVRVWLGSVAFDVFLWSVRMSADDYFDMIQTEGGLTPRAPDVCNASDCEEPAVCAGLCEKHSF